MKAQNNWKFIDEIGQSLPRVTYILKLLAKGEGFEKWLKNNAQEADNILNKAGDIGSALHSLLERIGKGEELDLNNLDDLQKQWIEQFLKWKEENKVKFLLTEQPVYNKEHLYCGTLDALVEINGEAVILDYKTAKYFYDSYSLQVAAYAYCFPQPPKKAIILRFDKETGKMNIKTYDTLDYEFSIFLSLLKVWNWRNPKKEVLNGTKSV